jgi:hypothetical protein
LYILAAIAQGPGKGRGVVSTAGEDDGQMVACPLARRYRVDFQGVQPLVQDPTGLFDTDLRMGRAERCADHNQRMWMECSHLFQRLMPLEGVTAGIGLSTGKRLGLGE